MASASYSSTGVGQRRSSFAEVGAACVVALISFLVIYKFGFLSILGGALALSFLWLVIIKPEAATLLFVAVMYSNAAAVAVRVHHVPSNRHGLISACLLPHALLRGGPAGRHSH